MTRCRVIFDVPDGGRVYAHPEEATRTLNGKTYVWVRKGNGEITRAFASGELA